jgi:hypothetical protein
MTETRLNYAIEVARWTCLVALAKDGFPTKKLLRRDGTLRYGLEADIRETLTAYATPNVRFLNEDLPTLSDEVSFCEVIDIAEASGNRVAAKWISAWDELVDEEAAKHALHVVQGAKRQ